MIFTAALFSTILGAVTGLIPDVVSYFRDKSKYEHEARLLELQGKYRLQDSQLRINEIDATAAIEEGKALYAHDRSLDGGRFINALRASVRPVLTYLFFFTWLAIKCYALYYGFHVQGQDLINVIPVIWDDDTAAIFGAIMGFWFGSRTIDQYIARKKARK